ncbi:sugar kinase [Cryobacterium sp. M91]|uniref:sugar kinase n=1 Tax=Cryobacterium sp. M91 TaxID=2048294 RepID=UPI000CE43092|nr:sugar kinase [Cryobacterium sp. M91]
MTAGATPGGVLTFGETMGLFRDPQPGMLALSRSVQLGMGGAESNVAIALKRLGTPVTWVGRVGRDSLGDLIQRELAAEGVNAIITVDEDAPTGLMIKERRMATATRVWYYRAGSAGSRLEPSDIPADVIRQASLLHVTGITPALSESAAQATRHAMSLARDAGVLVSFDLNYRSRLWNAQAARQSYRDLIALADIVFAGEDEAEIAVGRADSVAETARLLGELGPRQVIIKLGDRGCFALVDGISYDQVAFTVTVEDTVGAGDGFVAGYLSEVHRGSPVALRLQTAVSVGAFACTVAGDWEGMPLRSELGLLAATEPVIR